LIINGIDIKILEEFVGKENLYNKYLQKFGNIISFKKKTIIYYESIHKLDKLFINKDKYNKIINEINFGMSEESIKSVDLDIKYKENGNIKDIYIFLIY